MEGGLTDAPRLEYLSAYFTAELSGGPLPARFGVVTAHNPLGRTRAAEENEKADAQLRQELEEAGLSFFRVTGRSRDGAHQEPGWGIAADTPEAIRSWSRRFEQVAFFWVEEGVVFVINTGGARPHRVGRWDERLL